MLGRAAVGLTHKNQNQTINYTANKRASNINMMPLQRTTYCQPLHLFASAFLPLSCYLIVSGTRIVKGGVGQLKYFYDTKQRSNPFQNVVLLGVGTGMQTSDYDCVSTEMVQQGPVTVVVMDHAPGCFVKTCEKRFATMARQHGGRRRT